MTCKTVSLHLKVPFPEAKALGRPVIWGFVCTAASMLFAIGASSIFLSGKVAVSTDFLTGLLTFDSLVLAVLALTFPQHLFGDEVNPHQLMVLTFVPFVASALLSLYSLLQINSGIATATLGAQFGSAGYLAIYTMFWGLGSWAFVSVGALVSLGKR
jgi:hypothetical protein